MEQSQGREAFWAYLLLQLPGWGLAGLVLILLHRWVSLPLWAVVGLFALWVAKDLAMFPVIRGAFEPSRTGPEGLIGARGIAQERLAPVGYVRLGGELWKAQALRADEAIQAGNPVVVRRVEGLVLIVEPEEGGRPEGRPGGDPPL